MIDGARINPEIVLIEGRPALLMLPLELHGHHLHDPAFTPVTPGGTDVRISERLAVDLSSRTDIDFYTQADNAMIGGFAFPGDPHPAAWWRLAHEVGQLAVLVGPVGKFENLTTPGDTVARFASNGVLLGLVPLMLRGYPDGIGTAPAGRL